MRNNNTMTVEDVKIIELPKFLDARGNLSFAEQYGLYVPAGLWREINNFSTNSLALEFGS